MKYLIVDRAANPVVYVYNVEANGDLRFTYQVKRAARFDSSEQVSEALRKWGIGVTDLWEVRVSPSGSVQLISDPGSPDEVIEFESITEEQILIEEILSA